MPLIAMLDGQRVDATTYTAQAWSELQGSEDRSRLVMPLCEIQAVVKTLGTTQFFAHLSVKNCKADHGGESPQHRAMKAALRDRIDAVEGWHAFLEFPHPSREWIVDVLAESDDGLHRIAFEVQLSSQTPETYQSRSQRYFNDQVFPVWVVPRLLDHNQIKVPVVVTGFGKSSTVPADTGDIMSLGIYSDFSDQDTLGEFVEQILKSRKHWHHGSPSEQIALHNKAREREERQQQEADLKRRQLEERITEMNLNSAAPETAFGTFTVHTDGGPFVWATLTSCWSCEHPMMLWEASSTREGVQYSSAPALEVKREIRFKRYENHPDVHKAVDRWIREVRSDVQKAEIKTRRSKMKGAEYKAFVCPACDALIGQMFVSCLRQEKWSLISAPLLKNTKAPKPAAKASPAADPRLGKPQKQGPAIEPVVRTYHARPSVPEELQTDRRKTWAELHSPEGIAEARRKFMGTRGL